MEARRHRVFRVGEMEVDEALRLVRRDGETHRPRTRTFDLIIYLLERRDRIVSRQELFDSLWPGTSVTENSVMQCVNEARRCLGDDSRNPRYIRTVSKAGYQFIAQVQEEETAPSATVNAAMPLQPAPTPPPNRRWWRLALPLTVTAMVLAVASAKLVRLPPAPQRNATTPLWAETAWWKLNEGSGPQVRDSRAGLVGMMPAGLRWTAGRQGAGLLFPGPELAVHGADQSAVLPRGQAARTLTAWIRTTSTNGDTTVIFQEGEPQPDRARDRFYLALHASGVAGFGSADIMVGRTRVDDGRWHHLAGVFEGGARGLMRLYVDGAQDAAMPIHLELEPANTVEWSIGRALSGGTSFRGVIDDVRVFPRALNPSKIRSLHRCAAGINDVVINGQPHYYSSVFGDFVEVIDGGLRHTGNDFGGATFATRRADCSLESTASADLGQDFDIEMELKVDAPKGLTAEAGPYFRSRRASPGDGIFGGTSAGFQVILETGGRVLVRRLHPMATLAFSELPRTAFDSAAFHTLEAKVRADQVQVRLDGRAVEFDAGGARTFAVKLEPAWEHALPPGSNQGAVGIAFGSSRNRGQVGGQEARAIRVRVVKFASND